MKSVEVTAGLLKVVGKGVPFPVPNGAATVNVVLGLDGSTNRYCMSFSGIGDGSKFIFEDASAGSCGPMSPICPTGGDATACQAYNTIPVCTGCCESSSWSNDCLIASLFFNCGDVSRNDQCAASINAAGCQSFCCP